MARRSTRAAGLHPTGVSRSRRGRPGPGSPSRDQLAASFVQQLEVRLPVEPAGVKRAPQAPHQPLRIVAANAGLPISLEQSSADGRTVVASLLDAERRVPARQLGPRKVRVEVVIHAPLEGVPVIVGHGGIANRLDPRILVAEVLIDSGPGLGVRGSAELPAGRGAGRPCRHAAIDRAAPESSELLSLLGGRALDDSTDNDRAGGIVVVLLGRPGGGLREPHCGDDRDASLHAGRGRGPEYRLVAEASALASTVSPKVVDDDPVEAREKVCPHRGVAPAGEPLSIGDERHDAGLRVARDAQRRRGPEADVRIVEAVLADSPFGRERGGPALHELALIRGGRGRVPLVREDCRAPPAHVRHACTCSRPPPRLSPQPTGTASGRGRPCRTIH